jgi:uncharacterized damage-inducible protein DinB
MTTTPETAATVLARYENSWAALDKTLKALSEHELTTIRDPAGWSAKDHLSHLAAWDEALLSKLDGRPRHVVLGIDEALDRSEDYDAMNAAIFAATRERSLKEALDAVRATQAATRTHLSTLASGRSLSGADGFLADAPGYADHYDQHHGWIKNLVGR